MTVYTRPERTAPSTILEDVPIGFLSRLATGVAQEWHRAIGPSLSRRDRMAQAEYGPLGTPGLTPADFQNLLRRSQGLEPAPAEEINERRGLSRIITPDEARERIGELPLTVPAEGIREDLLDILIDTKRDEIRRQVITARSGFGTNIAAGLLGAALDPASVGLAFVPVIAPARFAIMAQRMGTTGARVVTGAAEGLVGAAIAEPIIFAQAQAEQADYDALDSLLNVAVGTILGGGLHVTLGAGADVAALVRGRPTLGDRLARASVETRETMLRTAVSQAVEGQNIDILPVVRSDPAIREMGATARGRSLVDALAADFELGQPTATGRFENYTPIAPGDRAWIEGVVAELEQTGPGQRIFREVEGQGSTPDVMGVEGDTPDWFRAANRGIAQERARLKVARRVNDRLPLEQQREIPTAPALLTRRSVRNAAKRLLAGKPLGKAQGDIALEIMGAARSARTINAEQIVEARRDRAAQRQQREAEEQAEIDAIAAREADAWREDNAADFESSDEAAQIIDDEPVPEAGDPGPETAQLEAELAEAEAELAKLELTKEEQAALQAAVELGEFADQEAAAYRTAARCLVGL